MDSLLLLLIAAFPLMGSPGPATLSLAALGAAYGFRRTMSYYVGIVLGTTGVLLLVASGVTGLLLAQPDLARAITLIAAIYILYLAFRIATAPVDGKERSEATGPRFIAGLLLAFGNPKAFAAIGAVYSGNTLIAGSVLVDAIAKVGTLACVIVIVNALWLAVGDRFSSALRNPTTGRIANISFAVLLVASVGFALV